MSGRVVILNGVPRSGKSSIAAAMQESVPGTWINFGVDAMMAMTPERLRPGIGLRPGGERADIEPFVRQLYGGLFAAVAALAREGLDVVCDLGLHDGYSERLGILADAAQRLAGSPVYLVKVWCPIEVVMARRNTDPQGGIYASGTGNVPAPVLRWHEAVYGGPHDLGVDTSVLMPEACAAAIARLLDAPPGRTVFEDMVRRG